MAKLSLSVLRSPPNDKLSSAGRPADRHGAANRNGGRRLLQRLVRPYLQFRDIDLPARKFAGKLSILTPASQNQRYLIGLDHDHRAVFRRMQDDPFDGRRLQGVGKSVRKKWVVSRYRCAPETRREN